MSHRTAAIAAMSLVSAVLLIGPASASANADTAEEASCTAEGVQTGHCPPPPPQPYDCTAEGVQAGLCPTPPVVPDGCTAEDAAADSCTTPAAEATTTPSHKHRGGRHGHRHHSR